MKINLPFLSLIAIGFVLTPCGMIAETFAFQKAMDKVDKASECKAFITITDKASGAANTMELSVVLRYINDLKQDLQTLKIEDSRLRSLQERYLQFAGDMGDKLARAKRDQSQGDYAAFQAATSSLTATGSRGIDLEQELQQYCRKP